MSYVTVSPAVSTFFKDVAENLAFANSPSAKLGAMKNEPISMAINSLDLDNKLGLSTAAKKLIGDEDSPGAVLGGSSGGSSGAAGSAADSAHKGAFIVQNGKVTFANRDLRLAQKMIEQQTAANNAFSAEQAQKQMDFQKMMSDTAHQREVADLQAAGLNPVLSAGGSGAQTTSGAMAQTDESNTRLIAELAGAAIEAVQNSAVGVAGAVASGKYSGSLMKNPYVSAFIRSGASVAGAIGARALLGAVGL